MKLLSKIVLLTSLGIALSFSSCSSDSDSSSDSPQTETSAESTVSFTVSFDTNGGTDIAPQSVEFGKTATKPTDPTKDGYVFAGWYTDSGLTAIFSFGEPVAKSITLYAKWIDASVPTVTVTFEADGGSSVDSQTVEPGKNAIKPIDPTREGLVFAGWYTDVDCTTVFDFDEPITKDIVLYAKWIDVPTYTVTFDTNGGSSVESQVVKSGTCVSEPAAPTKETVCENGHESEYEFAGWYMDSGFSEPFDFGSAVLADTKLYAKWNVRLSVIVKDGQSFNTFLRNTLGASDMTAFKRASEAPSTAAVYYLDKDETDPLIPIWYDTSSETVFYYIPDNVYKLKIESGYKMFFYCSSLTELDLSGFDTSNVTNMFQMFEFCSSLTELDVSGFDTSNVTNMSCMFFYCSSLTELDLSGFDTSNVTDMHSMFELCSSLTELDVSGFDTSNVTNMSSMFRNCTSLTELDVSGFDTGNVTNMEAMFYRCGSLVTIYASPSADWNHHGVENSNSMFSDCNVLKGGNGTEYSSSNVDVTYAHVDTEGNPGYFTAKN